VSWLYVYMAERPVQEDKSEGLGVQSEKAKRATTSIMLMIFEPVNDTTTVKSRNVNEITNRQPQSSPI